VKTQTYLRREVIIKRNFNPMEGRGYCSCCQIPSENAEPEPLKNIALDGVLLEVKASDQFFFICLSCARKIGKAAERT
jgi:hypothetical protein